MVATFTIVTVTCLNIIDLPIKLRFEEAKYNYLFVSILSIALPLSIFLSSFTLKKWARIMTIIISIVVAFPSMIVFFFASESFSDISVEGVDTSFDKISEVESNGSTYRLYRTNGGATTSFGLVLRKEAKLTSNIKTVKVIFSKYQAREGTLMLINKNSLELRIEPYNENDKLEVITLTI